MNKFVRIRSLLFVASLFAVITAAACGGGDDPTATPTASSSTATPGAATPTASSGTPTVPSGEFSGTATVAGRVEAQIFRVSLSGQGFADALLTRYGAFDGLLRADTVQGLEWGAIGGEGIGESWTIAPDQSKITFNIRE